MHLKHVLLSEKNENPSLLWWIGCAECKNNIIKRGKKLRHLFFISHRIWIFFTLHGSVWPWPWFKVIENFMKKNCFIISFHQIHRWTFNVLQFLKECYYPSWLNAHTCLLFFWPCNCLKTILIFTTLITKLKTANWLCLDLKKRDSILENVLFVIFIKTVYFMTLTFVRSQMYTIVVSNASSVERYKKWTCFTYNLEN